MKKVFIVLRNGDMTEGRGPMVIDSVFSSEKTAWEYANDQLGVMGFKAPKEGWKGSGHWNVNEYLVHEIKPLTIN